MRLLTDEEQRVKARFKTLGYHISEQRCHPYWGDSSKIEFRVLGYSIGETLSEESAIKAIVSNYYYNSMPHLHADSISEKIHKEIKRMIAEDKSLAISGDYDGLELEIKFTVKRKN